MPAAGGGGDAVSVTVGPATWTVAVTVGPGTVRVTVLLLPHAPMLTARPIPASPVAAQVKGFIRRFLGLGVFLADLTVLALLVRARSRSGASSCFYLSFHLLVIDYYST